MKHSLHTEKLLTEKLLTEKLKAYGKTASSGKKIKENGFHPQEDVFLLKLVLPNFSNGFQRQKKAQNKSIRFPLDRK